MGDPDLRAGDLSPGGSPSGGPVSLPDLIRAGDADAFAGFRDAHMSLVSAYCRVACAPELVSEACEAAFLDFVGRMGAEDPSDQSLKAVLLTATRSAAASRFAAPETEATEPGPRRVRRHPAPPTPTQVCAAMPELLAAKANGEFRGDDRAVAHHLAGCPLCSFTQARLQAAEAAFSAASGGLAGGGEGSA